MTILNILQFPDPKLRIKAQPINNFDEKLQSKIDDMFETMYYLNLITYGELQRTYKSQHVILDTR